MELSVVVPTLNARDELAGSLDALTEYAPDAEVIVVNGPSADGTTGMIRDREDVDVLVELADRTINAARNAGIDHATGDAVALLDHRLSITSAWRDAVRDGLDEADVVTGPTTVSLRAGLETEEVESETLAGQSVTFFNAGNAAFRREPLDELDGFDEYLETGGARDLAHRLAGAEYDVVWDDQMRVRQEIGADGGESETEWRWKYRSFAYRLVKNYGLRPAVVRQLVGHGGAETVSEVRDVLGGDDDPSAWLAGVRDGTVGLLRGVKDAVVTRRLDRTSRRNPRGRSSRADRAVTVYDWRSER